MKDVKWFFLGVIFVLVISLGVVIGLNNNIMKENRALKIEIQDLNREIGEYQSMADFAEDYMDLLDEIYQGKINEAVLEERIFWLEKSLENNVYDEDYIQQMYNDILIYVEELETIFRDTVGRSNLNNFYAWFEATYPDVWERIEEYNDLF